MKEINVAVIGSGSTYCPLSTFPSRRATVSSSRRSHLWISTSARGLSWAISACVCSRTQAATARSSLPTISIPRFRGAEFRYHSDKSRQTALPPPRREASRKYDLIGQGDYRHGGGFLLSAPSPLSSAICDRIEAICPDTWLINFTNPSGIITEFVLNNTNVKCIGLYNVPIDMLDDLRDNRRRRRYTKRTSTT